MPAMNRTFPILLSSVVVVGLLSGFAYFASHRYHKEVPRSVEKELKVTLRRDSATSPSRVERDRQSSMPTSRAKRGSMSTTSSNTPSATTSGMLPSTRTPRPDWARANTQSASRAFIRIPGRSGSQTTYRSPSISISGWGRGCST